MKKKTLYCENFIMKVYSLKYNIDKYLQQFYFKKIINSYKHSWGKKSMQKQTQVSINNYNIMNNNNNKCLQRFQHSHSL